LRWLVRFLPSEASRDSLLASIRALARSVGADARNPKWTSAGALELDVFCPTDGDFETFLAAVRPIAGTEFVTDLNTASPYLTDAEVLSKARGLFNAERYWECHEVLEGLWRQKRGEERRVLQGIILVCAAYVHHQKGEESVALGVLSRGANLLESPMQDYGDFDIAMMRSEALRMLEAGALQGFKV